MRTQRLHLTLVCLVLVVYAGQARGQQDLSTLIKRIQPAVITVIAYNAQGKVLQQGSGFFSTAHGQFITNRHVLQDAFRAQVKTWDGKLYDVRAVLAEDKAGDLLQGGIDRPAGLVPWLPITRRLPEVGERVVVVGSPLGLEQTVTDGLVSAIRALPELGKVVQITAPMSPGSSGSPVVNARGEVVGMATAQMRAGQNLNFAVPGERLLTLKPTKEKTLVEWTTGLSQEGVTTAETLVTKGTAVRSSTGCAAALPYFEQAAAINPRYAAAWRQVGKCLDVLHRFREAAEAFRQLMQLAAHDIDAHKDLARVYTELGRHQDAVAVYTQALRIAPNDAQLYASLCEIYGLPPLNRQQEAAEACRQVIRIAPNDPESYMSVGDMYNVFLHRRQDALEAYKQAMRLYQQAIRLNPDNAQAHAGLGRVYQSLERYPEAIAALQRAIRLKPTNAHAHGMLGDAYDRLERYPEAIAAYQEAIRLIRYEPKDSSPLPRVSLLHEGLAMIYEKLGRSWDVVEVCKQLVLLNPDDANAYDRLGVAYEKLNRWQDAVAAYQQAIRLNSDDAFAYRQLGSAYSEIGRYQDALAAYQQATRLKPNDAVTHYSLGSTSLILGDKGSAWAEYTILKDLDVFWANRLLRKIMQ